MQKLFLLYVAFCRRFGPDGYTYSAYAWRLKLEGRGWWCNRIDGLFLFWAGQRDHCASQFLRESANR